MKTAEVEVNTKVTFRANDADLLAFKLACVENRIDMAVVLREAMRRYVAEHKRKK